MSPVQKDDSGDELTDLDNIESEAEGDKLIFFNYGISEEKALSLDKNFVLAMSSKSSGSSIQVAAGLSNNVCEVLDIGSKGITTVASMPNAHTQPLTGVHINPETHMCYTSSLDGYVKAWDLRSCKKPALEMKDDSEEEGRSSGIKPITCFDMASNGFLICAGTEEIDGDSFLLFWDTRTGTLHGGYWETHTNDITQVHFHPTESKTLISGSTDGLINVFDVNEESEDDALQYCLNTEDSVEKLSWLSDSELSCTTLTRQVQLWNIEEACPSVLFRRKQIANTAQMKSSASCYLVDVYKSKNKTVLLTGSNHGKADCLRSVELCADKKTLLPHSQFIGNKQIVRCSSVHDEFDTILTAGEAGIVSVWKPSSHLVNDSSAESATKSESTMKPSKKRKPKPYA
uniref:WD repeat-containing protein 89 n=1 Tax=Cacopsylla melanoneura TaxID=428564 RepID=A0A8D8ZXP5_9HEMI